MQAKRNRRGLNQHPTSGMTPMQRFEFYIRVEDRGYLTPCWIWTFSRRTQNGYGCIPIILKPGERQRNVLVHRWRWEQDHGPVPDGLQLDHLCSQRLCARPDHLEPTTPLENSRRGRNAKLTLDQAVEIYGRRLTGERGVDLAREFGVSPDTVGLIKRHGPYAPRTPEQNARHRARRRAKRMGTAPD